MLNLLLTPIRWVFNGAVILALVFFLSLGVIIKVFFFGADPAAEHVGFALFGLLFVVLLCIAPLYTTFAGLLVGGGIWVYIIICDNSHIIPGHHPSHGDFVAIGWLFWGYLILGYAWVAFRCWEEAACREPEQEQEPDPPGSPVVVPEPPSLVPPTPIDERHPNLDSAPETFELIEFPRPLPPVKGVSAEQFAMAEAMTASMEDALVLLLQIPGMTTHPDVIKTQQNLAEAKRILTQVRILKTRQNLAEINRIVDEVRHKLGQVQGS